MRLAAKLVPLDRDERWTVGQPAHIRDHNGDVVEALLCDLSRTGCRVETSRPVEVGRRVRLVVKALGAKEAVVTRRTSAGCALQFVAPLLAHELFGIWADRSRAVAEPDRAADMPMVCADGNVGASRLHYGLAMLASTVLALALAGFVVPASAVGDGVGRRPTPCDGPSCGAAAQGANC